MKGGVVDKNKILLEIEKIKEKIALLAKAVEFAQSTKSNSVKMHKFLKDNDFFDNEDDVTKSLHDAEQFDAEDFYINGGGN